MATAVISDLTKKLVETPVRMLVLSHPDLDEAKELDCDYNEVKDITGTSATLVTVKFVTEGGAGEPVTLELAEFNKLFKGSPAEALANARAAKGNGNGSKRDPAYLNQVRTWARQNGYQVSDKGRIAAEVEAAYEAAVT